MARKPAYPVLNTGLWRREAAPPFEPPGAGALMAERRTVTVAARVAPAKRAAWQDKAVAT